MKTIIEWLKTLKEPHRTAAMNNVSYMVSQRKVPNLTNALLGAFDWENTSQGKDYWKDLYDKALHKPKLISNK